MPLVRIDVRKGKDVAYRQEIGRVVYEALVGVGVPRMTVSRSLVSTIPTALFLIPIISASIAQTTS